MFVTKIDDFVKVYDAYLLRRLLGDMKLCQIRMFRLLLVELESS